MSVLSYDKDALARVCRKHRIRRLALFGSVLTGTDRPDSDIDFLVEFEPDAVPGFLGLAEIEAELAGLLGRQVELRTANELSRYFREEVERSAEVQFAA
jgi:predicted nucleotidyltransferase